MQKGMGTAIAVWVAAIASAVVVIRQVEHPMRGTPAAGREIPPRVTETRQSDVSQNDPVEEDDDDGSIMVFPMDTIVGHVRGVTEMQHQDEVLIGPGTVTYPGPAEMVQQK